MGGGALTETEPKHWYQSKTVWVNVVTVIAAVAGTEISEEARDDLVVVVLAVVNIMLRLVSSRAISW